VRRATGQSLFSERPTFPLNHLELSLKHLHYPLMTPDALPISSAKRAIHLLALRFQ
jgi:hypothetical protein